MARLHPNVVVRHPSPNYSSRGGTRPRIIVLHASEAPNQPGALDNLGSWFGDPNSQVSSHVATDYNGNSARFVWDADKAWHVAYYNPVSLGIEQIGFSSQGRWSDLEVRETARWIARWSVMHGIPIRRCGPDGMGVLRHMDLGVAGGNHDDPGRGFPLTRCLNYARWYKAKLLVGR